MTLSANSQRPALELVDIIDFKWLAASDGLQVHVERLQRDPVYAEECLTRAANSSRAAVREAAARLRQAMGLDDS